MGQSRPDWTKAGLMELAKWQRIILWMILLSLVAMFMPFATIITGVIQIYFIYKLAAAVRSSAAWVYIILVFIPPIGFLALLAAHLSSSGVVVFIPLIGIFALLHINRKATKTLQSNGVKVGLTGARMADFEKMRETAQPTGTGNA